MTDPRSQRPDDPAEDEARMPDVDPAAAIRSREGLDPGGTGDLTGDSDDAPRDPRDVDDRPLARGDSGPRGGLGEAIGGGAGRGDVGAGTPPDDGEAGVPLDQGRG